MVTSYVLFKILYDQSSAGSRKFAIEPETGLVTTQGALDRETTSNYTVSTTDNMLSDTHLFCYTNLNGFLIYWVDSVWRSGPKCPNFWTQIPLKPRFFDSASSIFYLQLCTSLLPLCHFWPVFKPSQNPSRYWVVRHCKFVCHFFNDLANW